MKVKRKVLFMIKNCVAKSKKFFENAEDFVAWEGALSIEEAKLIMM